MNVEIKKYHLVFRPLAINQIQLHNRDPQMYCNINPSLKKEKNNDYTS